jgi:hypothetical protein
LAYLSDAYLRAGRLDDAHTMAERLLALGRERRERSTEARGWHLFGLYRAMDMTFWLPQAQAALAQVEGRQG